jgi:hypothetical protein
MMRSLLSVFSIAVTIACATASTPVPPSSCRAAYAAATLEKATPLAGDTLVWREERFDVPRPVAEYYPDFLVEAAHLEQLLPGTQKLPGVDHNEDLTERTFPAVGSRRLVCLRGGGFALEEVLELRESGFRYLVSNYSVPAARSVSYGIGEFRFEPLSPSDTRVTWRYSFKLRDDRFPGSWGALGGWLFRWSFLDRDYAEFMRAGLAAMENAAAATSTTRD